MTSEPSQKSTKWFAKITGRSTQPIRQIKVSRSKAGEVIKEPFDYPDLLLIEQYDDDQSFLFRFTKKGDCVGDSWHQTFDDAKHQAESEYEGKYDEWQKTSKETEEFVDTFEW